MKQFLSSMLVVFGIMLLVQIIQVREVLGANATLFLGTQPIETVQNQKIQILFPFSPGTEPVYTLQLELNFPPALLEFESFTYATGSVVPLTMAPYEITDNTNGMARRTVGFPGGISNPIVLGTATFRAKSTGSGIITLNGNSLALNENGVDVLTDTVDGRLVISSLFPPAPPATAFGGTGGGFVGTTQPSSGSQSSFFGTGGGDVDFELPIGETAEESATSTATSTGNVASALTQYQRENTAALGALGPAGTSANRILIALGLLVLAACGVYLVARASRRA